MTTDSAHDFFLASTGVAGALIGLLFVAISVTPESAAHAEAAEIRGIRASAALTGFTNALTVSLFGLVPGGDDVGGSSMVVALIGLLFVCGAMVRAFPAWRAGRLRLRDLVFLVGLVVVFTIQLVAGYRLHEHPRSAGALEAISDVIIACFLIGISRAWELVGGPDPDLSHQLLERLRARRRAG